MSTFFEKYKKIRRDQKIDLTDIENRTKINVKYLEAIESGNFEIIQQPYLRLFLKAYINEIGADPDVAIDELTEYLLKSEGGSKKIQEKSEDKQKSEIAPKKQIPKEKDIPDIPLAIIENKKKKQFNISPNLIKGILFIIAWVVIIIIIRNITIDTNISDQALDQNLQADIVSNFVDFEQLQSDYLEISSTQTALELSAPFLVKVITKNTLGIVARQDTFNVESIPMAGGSHHTFSYNSQLDLVLKHSNGVSVVINGNTVDDINSQADPVQITFSTDPNTATVKHYLPIE